ncbi:MAG TPA: nucleoside-diphosphate sugar epimerase/dehydratase [Candidatus Binataceae bacterium]|nr:nucleoside-diphosphate sugar epimerase/dehydratase [Candidatus Binataceae bacterium]
MNKRNPISWELRRGILVATDLAIIAITYILAVFLSQEHRAWAEWPSLVVSGKWIVASQIMVYFAVRQHETSWRYVSLRDAIFIATAMVGGSLFAFVVMLITGITSPSVSVIIIDAFMATSLLGAARAARRLIFELRGGAMNPKRVLIYGAGDAGELIVRDMKHRGYYGFDPIGFIDDDRAKRGRRIHNVKILGSREDLPMIVARYQPDEVLVAMTRVGPAALREILKALEGFRIPIRILPSLRDILNGHVSVNDIRNISLEDLLGRVPVSLETVEVNAMLQGRRVLVTGAGGSIGSELCRQIWSFGPATLVMYDHAENNLQSIENELLDSGKCDGLFSVVGDVRDSRLFESVLRRNRIEIVFHAAAHKHVPLMELNPGEAIKNNVNGTRTAVEASARAGVDVFMLVSTDKAVNPLGIMGASKRIAEMVVQDAARKSGMRFAVVRFGNVLGSSGSVVPRFLQQIRAGGPVTVTHPDMKRFFMLIPEAVSLVLNAATIAEPGVIYVLEMGEQVRIVDMAENLIRLAGYVPDKDIAIKYTALRPGEKLYEELVSDQEEASPSDLQNIMLVRPRCRYDEGAFSDTITALETAAQEGNDQQVNALLQVLIPNFRRIESVSEPVESSAIPASTTVQASVDDESVRFLDPSA